MTLATAALVFLAALAFGWVCLSLPGWLAAAARRREDHRTPELLRSMERAADARARREA